MPDKFRILDDSFSGDAPLPEDDGFQNFNALSRFGGEPDAAADRSVEPHSDHEVRLSAGDKASDFSEKPFARQVNSPPFGQKNLGLSRVDSMPAESPLPKRFAKRSDPDDLPNRVSSNPDGTGSQGDWRQMSLREMFTVLRVPSSEKPEAQQRLRGMFKR